MVICLFFVGLALIVWYFMSSSSTVDSDPAVEEKASDEAGISGEAKP